MASTAISRSRNCLEDEEEEATRLRLEEHSRVAFEMRKSAASEQAEGTQAELFSPVQVDLLVVGVGKPGADFARICFPTAKHVADIVKERTASPAASSTSPLKRSSMPVDDFDCKLYVSTLASGGDDVEEASVAVLECNSKVEPENCFVVAALLAERVQAKRVVIYGTMLVAEYQNTETSRAVPPLMRALDTDSLRNEMESGVLTTDDKTKPLEAGNIVAGFTAMLLTEYQALNVPARVFVALREARLGIDTAMCFASTLGFLRSMGASVFCEKDRDELIMRKSKNIKEKLARHIDDLYC